MADDAFLPGDAAYQRAPTGARRSHDSDIRIFTLGDGSGRSTLDDDPKGR